MGETHGCFNHYLFFYEPGSNTTIKLHWRRTLVLFIFIEQIKNILLYLAKHNYKVLKGRNTLTRGATLGTKVRNILAWHATPGLAKYINPGLL
jgi:hypothetical protein